VSKDVKIFKSKFLAQKIVIKPAHTQEVEEDGRKRQVKNPGHSVQFVKGKYETSDPKEVSAVLDFMKKNPNKVTMISKNAIDKYKAIRKKAAELVEKEKADISQADIDEAEAQVKAEEEAAAAAQSTPSSDQHGKEKPKDDQDNKPVSKKELKADLEGLTMDDLKEMAKSNGIQLVGDESKKKDKLVDRLVKELFNSDSPDLGDK
jgi:hypothetical protein